VTCEVEVLRHRPLSIRFSLRHPAAAPGARLVPRTLQPLGFFVTIAVADASGRTCYESERPKVKLKLHPDREGSYVRLEPGEQLADELTVDDADLALTPGTYRLTATYTNGPFTGPAEDPIGALTCECEVTFTVPA
jgi:hypothetical protein